MKSSNLFTYILYALLGTLLLAAGYLALETSKENKRHQEELRKDAEQLDQVLRSNGTIDTTTTSSSAYIGETEKNNTVADQNGIEQDAATKTTATTDTKVSTPATAAPASQPAVKPTTASTPDLVVKGGTVAPSTPAPTYSGRYYVVAGAFSQIANARSEMEKFVKMGYREAEVMKYKNNLWRVVVKRCKTRTEAVKYETDLARNGMDAMVVDSYKK